MPVTIRQAVADDALLWLDLLKSVMGDEYPAKEVYNPEWIKTELDIASGSETWMVMVDSKIHASVTILSQTSSEKNPVINLGRILVHPSGYADGSLKTLLFSVRELAIQRKCWVIARVLASDNEQQICFENAGFVCVGFQPFKHIFRVREGVLYYVNIGGAEIKTRAHLSDSLPQVSEIAQSVLDRLSLPRPENVRNGITGYPLQSDVAFHESSADDYELWRMQAMASNPPIEIARGANQGFGYLRVNAAAPLKAILAQRDQSMVAGLLYSYDELDRCVRVIDAFGTDGTSTGVIMQHLIKLAQSKLNALYAEVDVLITALRLLKSTEQIGFVPVAYFPGFQQKENQCIDVVKLVKLNLLYSLEHANLTSQASAVVKIIDHNFEDQKVGQAIINLLQSLPIFAGLGDGELRKIARLFTQKLYRPGETLFKQGDSGNEAFVVMRGLVNIHLEGQSQAIATITNGQIFGEQAFLDGAPRGATAQAGQASILLVIKRSAFNDLVEHEPHLGMIVMRNTAIELSKKLRKTDALLMQLHK